MTQNEYDVIVVRVVDGDTVDVDIDLGFGICLKNERVRIMGIDTPESRTRDKVEKLFGKAAGKRLGELLKKDAKLITTEDKNGEDMKGKFGRILGDFRAADGRLITEIMISEGHAVPYFGGSKEETQAAHAENRKRLLAEGVISRADYDAAVKLMESK
jgi:micrococcal nuclease